MIKTETVELRKRTLATGAHDVWESSDATAYAPPGATKVTLVIEREVKSPGQVLAGALTSRGLHVSAAIGINEKLESAAAELGITEGK